MRGEPAQCRTTRGPAGATRWLRHPLRCDPEVAPEWRSYPPQRHDKKPLLRTDPVVAMDGKKTVEQRLRSGNVCMNASSAICI
jgi:hypothetical protein